MSSDTEYSVGFLPDAVNDISGIITAFVSLGSKQGAIRIREKINKAARQIRQFPYSGCTVRDEKLAKSGFRMIVVENYLMFYKVFEDEKNILFYRVLNGKRNYPALMQKLNEEYN